MADDQNTVNGGEFTTFPTVIEMGQLDIEAGTLGLDAISDGEIVGIIDLGTLRVSIDNQKVQLAFVNPFAGAAGLVLQTLGNLEYFCRVSSLTLSVGSSLSTRDTVAWDTPASCAISFNVAMHTPLAMAPDNIRQDYRATYWRPSFFTKK